MVLVPLSVHTFSSLLVVASLRLALVFFNTSPVSRTTLVFGVVSAPSLLGMDTGCRLVQWSTDCAPHTLRRAVMRLEVCGGESCKGGVGYTCTFGRRRWSGRSFGGGERVEVFGRWRGSGEVLGRRRGSREVLGRRRRSGRSL